MEEDEVLVDEGKRKEIFATAALTPGLLIRFPAWVGKRSVFLRPPSSVAVSHKRRRKKMRN